VCGVPFLFASALPVIYVLLFLIGIGMAGGYPNTMAEVNRRFPGRTGTVSGMLTFGAGAGAMVFLWLIGFTAEKASLTGSMAIPFVLMALMTVTFTLAVRKKKA
jgi:MFS family permease